MYQPRHFREDRPEVLHALMREHCFATLVTLGPDGLTASHLPVEFDPEPGPFGTLRGHLARANPQWRDFSPDVSALVIFSGPQAYVTPSWYATKSETGRVVPTWNYVTVHAYGRMETFDDPERLKALVTALTERQEKDLAAPWQVDDAPADHIERLLKGIVGIELAVERLEGKWKLSQDKSAADRAGVIDGLSAVAGPDALRLAEAMSGTAGRRGVAKA